LSACFSGCRNVCFSDNVLLPHVESATR
jgi:hypothetical protein